MNPSPYPAYYHKALNAIIHNPYDRHTRNKLAEAICKARKSGDKDFVRHIVKTANLIAWPIKLRPNGRYL